MKYIKDKPQLSTQEIDFDTDKKFLDIYEVRNKQLSEMHPSYKRIPKFLKKSDSDEKSLLFKFKEEVRARFLNHKAIELLDQKGMLDQIGLIVLDLEQIYQLLKKNISPPFEEN